MVEHIAQLDFLQRQIHQRDTPLVGGVRDRRHSTGRAEHWIDQEILAGDPDDQRGVAEEVDLHMTSYDVKD